MKSKTQIVPLEESIAADWTDARQILNKIQLHGRLFLLGQVLLGWKLASIKKTLGFDQRGGDRKSKCQVGTLIETWEGHLESELGITKRTAYRFEQLHTAAQAKMKRLGGNARALSLLAQDPTDLDDEAHQTLRALVEKITDGETQKSLLEEIKLVKAPQGSAATGGNKPAKQETPQPTLWDFARIHFGNHLRDLIETQTHSDYQKALYALPLIADDDEPDLTKLELRYQSQLADVQKAKATALKNAQTQIK